jgi:GAF domain-containing protein
MSNDADVVTDTLRRMGAVVLNDETVENILDLVTVLTKRVVGSAVAVGITLHEEGRPFTSNASGELARTLDEAQYAADRGPCLQVARTDDHFVNEPLAEAGGEWPEFSAAAAAEGVRSIMSLPLTVNDHTIGVLNIYGADEDRFAGPDEATARLLAEQAAVVLANALAFAGAEQLNVHLRKAVESRDLIGQAKGILMARQGCSADEAFDILRRASQRTNRKVNEVAQSLVESVDSSPRLESAV